MPESVRHLFASLSIVVSIGGFLPYVGGIYRGSVRPHLVGWLIWTLLTAVIFFAQLLSGGGAGAWTTAVICLLCFVALVMSLFRGDKSWKAFDIICFGLTLISIPLWLWSGSPLYSVILLTFIEFLGFAAMTPKTWRDPKSESLSYFVLSIFKYVLSAAALDIWSWETALYPVVTAFMAIVFSLIIFIRRFHPPKVGANA
jgi:hypothetical protein